MRLLALIVLAWLACPSLAEAWTSIASCTGTTVINTDQIACDAALTVQSGDLLIYQAGTSTTVSINITAVENGGGSSFSNLSQRSTTNATVRSGYIVSAGGTLTPVVDFGAAPSNAGIRVAQWRPDGGTTAAFVAGTDAGATGSSTTPTSAAVSATGTSNLLFICAGRGTVAGEAWTSHLINGGAPTTAATAGLGGLNRWWLVDTSTFASGTCSATSTDVPWSITGGVFEEQGAASTGHQNLLLRGVGE